MLGEKYLVGGHTVENDELDKWDGAAEKRIGYRFKGWYDEAYLSDKAVEKIIEIRRSEFREDWEDCISQDE